jgi:hypothetical protein
MLRSKRKSKDMEGITAILTEDFGETLAESLVVRYFAGSGGKEKFREGLSMMMTPREVENLLRRIDLEMEANG